MATTYRIHPSVGIARVGNQEGTTEQDYFIGPESPGHHPVPAGGYKRGGKIKRQAARFRVYEYETDAASGQLKPTREITSDHATIKWTVLLANRKAAGRTFPPSTSTDVRNPTVPAAQRERLLVLQRKTVLPVVTTDRIHSTTFFSTLATLARRSSGFTWAIC